MRCVATMRFKGKGRGTSAREPRRRRRQRHPGGLAVRSGKGARHPASRSKTSPASSEGMTERSFCLCRKAFLEPAVCDGVDDLPEHGGWAPGLCDYGAVVDERKRRWGRAEGGNPVRCAAEQRWNVAEALSVSKNMRQQGH